MISSNNLYSNNKWLIENHSSVDAISAESSQKKTVCKRRISILHLWWGRRLLNSYRAGVYRTLVPILRGAQRNGSDCENLDTDQDKCQIMIARYYDILEKTIELAVHGENRI